MRLSRFFLPTLKDIPAEAQIVSHRLMLRAGLVRQTAAGIYSWLPLGLRVLRRIEAIVREEQARAGAVEVLMPTLQSADLWRESGRYDAYGPEMLRFKDRHERDLLYAPTCEEQITDIVRQSVQSYKQLPLTAYHIQWKFRDEIRPRFGVMRGREFLMKDGYSFDVDEAGARHSYHVMFLAYLRTFARMGLTAVPVRAETGPIGGDLSHEFLIRADTGESAIYYDSGLTDALGEAEAAASDDPAAVAAAVARYTQYYSAADEKHDPAAFAQVPTERQAIGRGIEVGHIFYFGTKYSEAMQAGFVDRDGVRRPYQMGSYGIGVSRLVGAIIEASHDDKGIIWPAAVAPFDVIVLNLKPGDAGCDSLSERLYAELTAAGREVLLHDTEGSAGAKFAEAELIGIPTIVIIGVKNAAAGQVEIKDRRSGRAEVLPVEAATARLLADA